MFATAVAHVGSPRVHVTDTVSHNTVLGFHTPASGHLTMTFHAPAGMAAAGFHGAEGALVDGFRKVAGHLVGRHDSCPGHEGLVQRLHLVGFEALLQRPADHFCDVGRSDALSGHVPGGYQRFGGQGVLFRAAELARGMLKLPHHFRDILVRHSGRKAGGQDVAQVFYVGFIFGEPTGLMEGIGIAGGYTLHGLDDRRGRNVFGHSFEGLVDDRLHRQSLLVSLHDHLLGLLNLVPAEAGLDHGRCHGDGIFGRYAGADHFLGAVLQGLRPGVRYGYRGVAQGRGGRQQSQAEKDSSEFSHDFLPCAFRCHHNARQA